MALCVAESTGDLTGALSFEVGGYNKLDGDIQKVTHQRKNARTQMGVSRSLHVSQTRSGVSLLEKQSRVKPGAHAFLCTENREWKNKFDAFIYLFT